MTFNASKSLAHLKICSCGAKWDPVVVHGQFHPTQGPYSPIFSCAPLATAFNSSFFSLLTCPAICMPRRCKSTVADCYETMSDSSRDHCSCSTSIAAPVDRKFFPGDLAKDNRGRSSTNWDVTKRWPCKATLESLGITEDDESIRNNSMGKGVNSQQPVGLSPDHRISNNTYTGYHLKKKMDPKFGF